MFWLVGCTEPAETGTSRAPGDWTDAEIGLLSTMRLDTPPADPSNRFAENPDAIALGRRLFFDGSLSPTGTIACATCHRPDRAFADGEVLGTGVGKTARHTPGIAGMAWERWFFWDGRADSLWSQALGPMENPAEMGSDRVFVARAVLAYDAAEYAKIFGEAPDLSDPSRFPPRAKPGADSAELAAAWAGMAEADRATVNRVFSNIGKAIAAYERQIVPGVSRFDRYIDAVAAGDRSGGGRLSEPEIRGLSTFVREGGCANCHHGPLLTDRTFHNLGLPEPVNGYDPGRQIGAARVSVSEFNCRSPWSDAEACPELEYLNPNFPDFQAAFKTPSLRGVTESAPYMHNGSMATLGDVLAFYDALEGEPPAGHRELTLKPLHLSAEAKADLIAFLGALSAETPGDVP